MDRGYDLGGDNTLWVGLNTGEVQHITTSGTLLSSFDPGHGFFPGITTDGTYLYLTDGLYGTGAIETWTFGGTMLSSVSTGFAQNLGIGYDASDSTFWVGYYEIVRHFDSSGNLLGSISGGLGAWHDGIDVGEIGTVPDASIMFLLGPTLIGLVSLGRKRTKTA